MDAASNTDVRGYTVGMHLLPCGPMSLPTQNVIILTTEDAEDTEEAMNDFLFPPCPPRPLW
jgi:hypothetical protein